MVGVSIVVELMTAMAVAIMTRATRMACTSSKYVPSDDGGGGGACVK